MTAAVRCSTLLRLTRLAGLAPATLALAAAAEPYPLIAASGRSTPSGQTLRVDVELELGGELVARNHLPLAAGDAAGEPKPHRSPIRVTAVAAYDERPIDAGRVARLYQRAEATIETPNGVRLPRLARGRRAIVATRPPGERLRLASAGGLLPREQLELIEMLGDPATLDDLLPGRAVHQGEPWEIEESAAARLLGLDAVSSCGLVGEVDDGNRRYTRFSLRGRVEGAIDAAATRMEVRAIGLFRHDCRRVVQLNLAVTEDRRMGPARPGLEGTAKLKIKRTPVGTPPGLADGPLAELAALPTADQGVLMRGGPQGFELTHERGWFIAAEAPRSVTLRLVGPAGLIAQTTLQRQTEKPDRSAPTPQQLRAEAAFSTGEGFGDVISTEQWINAHGCRCVGLTARGDAGGVPVERRFYWVSPGDEATGVSAKAADAGHLVAMVTTVEQQLVDRLGDADRQLADRLRLIRPEPPTARVARVAPPAVRKRTPRRVGDGPHRPTRRAAGTRQRR